MPLLTFNQGGGREWGDARNRFGIGPIMGPYLDQLGPQTPYLAAPSLALVMTLVAIWSLTKNEPFSQAGFI